MRCSPRLAAACRLLRSLHDGPAALVLPNVWDVASARAVVEHGFPVVATSSGAVASSLGYTDHEGAPRTEMLRAARRISRSVDVPVTVDAEAGYGLSAPDLARALLAAGASGCNVEDTDHRAGGLRDGVAQAAYVRNLRAAADELAYPLVINARVDVFLGPAGAAPPATVVDEGLARARSYLAAGADCVFPILLRDQAAIGTFVRDAGGPVNVLAVPGLSIPALAALGVRRISFGSRLHRDTMAQFATLLDALDGR